MSTRRRNATIENSLLFTDFLVRLRSGIVSWQVHIKAWQYTKSSRGLSDSIPSKLNYLSKAREYYLKTYKHKGSHKIIRSGLSIIQFLALHAILGGGASYDLDKKKRTHQIIF